MKKRALVAVPVIAFVALVVGCTSLIGDFDVSQGNPSGDGGGEGGACTQCGAECVDLTSSSAHCGKCEISCTAGQTCQASECKCPADQAFCDSKCVKADRNHCGATCVACQSDEICSAACVAAPAPAFEKKPLESTGWIDENSKPLSFTLKATGSPGTIYECRTGPDATFTPSTPEWKPCDGATGTGTTHTPTADPAAPEGTYRTEYRYRSDTYRSPSISYVYYAHHQLDRAATCPRAGHPEDGPKFTDDQFFAAAQAYSTSNAAKFPTLGTFPAPGNPAARTDAIFLRDPWIKIPFTGVKVTPQMKNNSGLNNPPWPADGADYTVNERSLRHRFALNGARTMVLMERQYIHPKTKATPVQTCKNLVRIGNKLVSSYGPAEAKRGPHDVDCLAYILNSHGNALCMTKNAAGTAPEPLAIDVTPVPGASFPGGTIGVTATGLGTATSMLTAYLNWYIEVPSTSTWYKITAVPTPNTVQLTPAPGFIIPPGTQFRVSKNLTPVYDIPTGYVKLHQGAHGASLGLKPPGVPSGTSKCEAPGCNTNKPWLTFLPP
ncbi:MAG TPA: hypothetical protein VLT33_41410 [Labilithrix sp.]|nr:hypothetical protein [Labilithrix sp.]